MARPLMGLNARSRGLVPTAAGPQCDEDTAAFASRVLLFSETAGPRSDAIPAAKAAICEAARGAGIAVDHTENGTRRATPSPCCS